MSWNTLSTCSTLLEDLSFAYQVAGHDGWNELDCLTLHPNVLCELSSSQRVKLLILKIKCKPIIHATYYTVAGSSGPNRAIQFFLTPFQISVLFFQLSNFVSGSCGGHDPTLDERLSGLECPRRTLAAGRSHCSLFVSEAVGRWHG